MIFRIELDRRQGGIAVEDERRLIRIFFERDSMNENIVLLEKFYQRPRATNRSGRG